MPDLWMRQRRAAQMFVLTLAALLPVGLVGVVLPAPAEAATLRTWNRLAWCESSGRWHINSGNGYYGGLQFSGPTWRAFGGARFARYAHRATKAEQIRVAERVRRHQGWRAWPSCSSAGPALMEQ